MDVCVNDADSNGFLRYRHRKNVSPERLIQHLNDLLIVERLFISPFLHIGGTDIARIKASLNGEPGTEHSVGEIVVRSRNGGTLLYQDMDVVLRSSMLVRKTVLVPMEYAVSGHGAVGEIPPLHITLSTSSDGHPAMVRRRDAVYRGFLRKDAKAPIYTERLLPTETMLDASLDGKWHYA